jgi:hypothetical protein
MPYVISATGSVVFRIDSNDDESDCVFRVEQGTSGSPILSVGENGWVQVYGTIQKSGAVGTENTDSSTDVVRFLSQASVKAAISSKGTGIFLGGLRLRRDTGAGNPDAARLAGDKGDLVLWNNSGTGLDELWACYDGPNDRWNRATQP